MSGIFVCFFGITRSLRYTIGSIERRVTGPARALAPTRLYAHLYDQDRVVGPGGREEGRLVQGEHRMLGLDKLELEAPGGCLDLWGFERLKAHGDTWGNDFVSVRNLIHQLHSLHRVTSMALEDGAEVCVFVIIECCHAFFPLLKKSIQSIRRTTRVLPTNHTTLCVPFPFFL